MSRLDTDIQAIDTLVSCGISPLQPGYAEIQIRPEMPDGLKSVTTSYDSVRGLIGSSWTVSKGMTTWRVEVPVNASAEFFLPVKNTPLTRIAIKEGQRVVYKDGRPTQPAPGIAFERTERIDNSNAVVWRLGSGSYRFTLTPANAQ